MSEYSLDSLENASVCSPKHDTSLGKDSVTCNLKAIKPSVEFRSSSPFYLNSAATASSSRIKDIRANETTEASNPDRTTKTSDARNAIIAKGDPLNRVSRRGSPARVETRGITLRDQRSRRRTGNDFQQERHEFSPLLSKHTKSSPKRFSRRRTPPRSLVAEAVMKPDKKLGNVSVPSTKKPCSYLELHRRRLEPSSHPKNRSPEGSTLSICGDSQQDEVTENDTHHVSSRDDPSELSFYRRLIERPSNAVIRTSRSWETGRQRLSESSFALPRIEGFKCDGCKSRRRMTYRPYTLADYKSLSIPRPDRSLGPDIVEIRRKREWLMRRRSYGDSVSAHNRQQILCRAWKLKSGRATAQKCLLPSLKDSDAGSKERENINIDGFRKGRGEVDGLKRPATRLRKARDFDKAPSDGTTKISRKSSNSDSLTNSYDLAKDSYLESLRTRHRDEKELVDRLLAQTLI